jgi:hypothetical protein
MGSLFPHEYERGTLSELSEGAIVVVPDILKRVVQTLGDFAQAHTLIEKQLQGHSLSFGQLPERLLELRGAVLCPEFLLNVGGTPRSIVNFINICTAPKVLFLEYDTTVQ